MKHIYLEVDIVGNHATIIDWTQTFGEWYEREMWRELSRCKTGFIRIEGKEVSYHIKGLGENVKRCQSFAVWYHVNKSSGNISTYRLD